jgi:hypothetical protein
MRTISHPVRPDWTEIARVLTGGGVYFAQHVGPGSARELIEWFLGPLDQEQWLGRDPEREAAAARAAGLQVADLRTARCRMEFFDIGAVVPTRRGPSSQPSAHPAEPAPAHSVRSGSG